MPRLWLTVALVAGCTADLPDVLDPFDWIDPPPPEGELTVVDDPFPGDAVLSTFADCDHDGRLELFRPRHASFLRLGDDGTWIETKIPGLPETAYDVVLVTDLDRDGHEDLVVGYDRVELARGTGPCAFAPPVALGPATKSGRIAALTTADLDRDGLTDLGYAVAFGRDEVFGLLHAREDGGYDPIAIPSMPWAEDPFAVSASGWLPFAMHLHDLDHDGALDLFAMADTLQSWFAWGDPRKPFTFRRDEALTARLGEMNAMASARLDSDADGEFEVFLSGNGSNNLLLEEGSRAPRDLGVERQVQTFDLMWSAYPVDADLDGATDLLVGRTGILPSLYWNTGHRFVDLGESHVSDPVPSQNLSCGDLRGDGRICCFATAHEQFPMKEALIRNDVAPAGAWLGLDLRGTLSGARAAGARVHVTAGEQEQWLPWESTEATRIRHASGLVVGLGAATTADVEVHWPSGLVTRAAGLASGTRHRLHEPALLTLPARTLPADGTSTLPIDLHRPEGAADATLALDTGTGRLEELPAPEPGVRRYLLHAPAAPGRARLLMRVDGHPLVVRPRIRFVAD